MAVGEVGAWVGKKKSRAVLSFLTILGGGGGRGGRGGEGNDDNY